MYGAVRKSCPYFALFYVAGAVLVWTIFYFEVKHIRKLSSVYAFVVISM